VERVTIEALTLKGLGRATNSAPIARVLPGEVVTQEGKILTPSIHRVTPPCRHFKSCGGCALQHASDGWVADWKTDVIAQGLAAHGIETEIRAIQTSPPHTRRRATLHGRRTKKGALVGFKSRGTDTLVEVPDCHLLDPDLLEALPFLESITRQFASRKGELDFALTKCDAGLDLDVHGAPDLKPAEIETLATASSQNTVARLSWNGDPVAVHHPAAQSFGSVRLIPPPGAFLQATSHGEETLWTSVKEGLSDVPRLADLFAGCGTFALRAAQFAEVEAFEGDAELTMSMQNSWKQQTLPGPEPKRRRRRLRHPLSRASARCRAIR